MKTLTQNTQEMAIAENIFNNHPFATLVLTQNASGAMQVCHLPFLYSKQDNSFYCHVSANNPVVSHLKTQAMLLFQAEHGYVSPTWSEDIRVPTWDYCVVHIHGTIAIIEDEEQAKQSMANQVAAFEQEWSMAQPDDKLLGQMLKAIKVLKFSIEDMQYRFKMSQNKSADAKAAIIEQFKQSGKTELVERYQQCFG